MRCCIMDGLDGEILAKIQRFPSQTISYVEMFLQADEFVRNQEILNVRLKIHKAPGVYLRTHNRPTCDEVTVILLDDTTGAERIIILHQRIRGLQRISDTHPAYDQLHFTFIQDTNSSQT